MINKIIITLTLMYSVSSANTDAKFLVLDSKTYEQIENLNILNGGIKKNIVVSSTELNKEVLLQKYPEIFLYSGRKCTILNEIVTKSTKTRKSMLELQNKKNITKMIQKVKLLQLLVDNNSFEENNSKITLELIKSIGMICDNRLFVRGKYYNKNDLISSFKIIEIDSKSSTIIIKE